MNRRKLNISRWYALGLAAVLVAASLLLAIGTTWARYRTEVGQETNLFEARRPISVTLGKLDDAGNFGAEDEILWEKQTDGKMLLNFAISNANADEDAEKPYLEESLEVRVRLVGSLAAWSESETAKVILTDGTLLKSDFQTAEPQEKEFTAEVMRIPEKTALYYSFGDGWVFRFLDEEGEELTWILEGGQLSCVEMNITIDSAALAGTSLLQLQIIGEIAD